MDLKNKKETLIENFKKLFKLNQNLNEEQIDLDTLIIYFESQLDSNFKKDENLLVFLLHNYEFIEELNEKTIMKNSNEYLKVILINLNLIIYLIINHKENFDVILSKIHQNSHFKEKLTKLDFKSITESSLKAIIKNVKLFKNKQNLIIHKFFEYYIKNYETLKTTRNKKNFALILEILRVLSENKLLLKEMDASEVFFNKMINLMLYFNEVVKIKKNNGNLKILSLIIKIIRNMIFCKISIKKKNLLKNFFDVFKDNVSNEVILTDILRILIKISEKEKVSLKLSSFDNLEDLIKTIFLSNQKNNYILNANLELLGNLLTFNEHFSKTIYGSEIMNFLIALFEKKTEKSCQEKDQYEDMLKSFTHFEFLQKTEVEFIEKLIRIFANIFTCKDNSLLFLQNNFHNYKKILKTLRFFLNDNQMENKVI